MSPSPSGQRSGPHSPAGAAQIAEVLTASPATVADLADARQRRHEAALRLPPLADGRHDPDMHRAAGRQNLDAEDGYCCAAMGLELAAYCASVGRYCGPGNCARGLAS